MVIGPPPWDALVGQRCIRFACWKAVVEIAKPWVLETLLRMREDFPSDHLVDIRYWPTLERGFVPGAKVGPHRDITRVKGRHRLYVAGAGSLPLFEPYREVREGETLDYSTELHSAQPATYTGPRLLLRLTQPDSLPLNRVTKPWSYRP
jgi:hypothetical protein